MKTYSEELFENFCTTINLHYEEIPREDGKKTPDYLIYPSQHKVVVEVKQINPNDKEKKAEQQIGRGNTITEALGGTPGERVRHKISDAQPQLAALAKGRLPSVLVLFSNVLRTHRVYERLHTDPDQILVAMYGLVNLWFSVPRDRQVRPFLSGTRFGPKQKMTPKDNTTISALGVIYMKPRGDLQVPCIDIYHNWHAQIPLPPECLRPYGIEQFSIAEAASGKYHDWVSC